MDEHTAPDIKQGQNDNKNKEALAKKYSRTNRTLSLTQTVIFYALLLILLFTGLSETLAGYAYSYSSNDYIALLIFIAIIGIAESLITFPLNFYSDYILEHKYGLSNQTISIYFKEKLKGLALAIVLGIPLLLAFYFILRTFPELWWLILGMFLFLISVVFGRLAPTLIMPIFYKFKPIQNESLNERIMNLSKKAGVTIQGIFTFDMSKNTKKANAAFTGMGKSKRIILGDTLVDKFNEDEIEVVFAHEMGHYTKKHIAKLVTVSTVLTFAGLYIVSLLYKSSLNYFGFENVYDIAAIPLLFLYFSLYGLVTSPITNILSRKFEWEADSYALETTRNKSAFITAMEKLADQNLADRKPNEIIEFLFHSHPSIEKRVQFAKNYEL